MSAKQIVFGSFRFDPVALQLWKDERVVAVQPKPLTVLRALAARSGQVVTKQALLKEVWAGTYVTQAVLKVAVRALREALSESADSPEHLETVGRDGYRFIGRGISRQDEENQKAKIELPSPASSPQPPAPIIVGREAELAQLHKLLDKSLRGESQLVFVTGEPGIGKTTLVEAFLQSLKSKVQGLRPYTTDPRSLSPDPWLGHGQCIEQYGQGEPYLPVLEALGRLCRETGGERLVALLRQHAPTWLVQLPGVMKEGELQALQLQVQGATQQRMLREIAEAIEVGAVSRPLVLIFEDLHWSDSATIEFLSYLAKRRQPMRLLVVATYRPVDVVMGNLPLKTVKQELQAHGLCEEIRVELLKKPEIEEYVARRFPEHDVATVLAPEVYRRTDGNPLFMVNVVEHCITQGLVAHEQGRWVLKGEIGGLRLPESLRQLIAQQVERLTAEQRQVLEGASVAGAEFLVASVAAALRQEMDEVETICEEVAGQGHFLEERGITEWPDGTISGRYGFRHALYQNVLYDRIAEARRVRLHRLIGERGETAYGERAREIASELAVHFERGHDYRRAVRYCEQAGKNAIRRSAHREAIAHLAKGLELLKTLPDTPERAQQELTLQITLGGPLMATKGYSAPEVEKAYDRARELCRQIGETPQLFLVLIGLAVVHIVRGELRTAQELTEQMLRLAESAQELGLLVMAHHLLGQTWYFQGEFISARTHFEQGLAVYDFQQHHSLAFLYGTDPGEHCLCFAAYVLWSLGYPDQALRSIHKALALAQQFSHPFNLAFIMNSVVAVHQMRREVPAALEWAEKTLTLCHEQGFALLVSIETIIQGWALAEQGQGEEGITQIRQGVIAHQVTGAVMGRAYYLLLLAEACGKTGEVEEGLNAQAEALDFVEKTGERRWEAEIYRLKGELTLQQFQVSSSKFQVEQSSRSKVQGPRSSKTKSQRLTPNFHAEAEGCFLKAIDIAQRQQAKSLELRATTSLARLWQQQGKKKQAHEMLATVYNWFTEGFDTKDLQEAKALIEELGH